MLFISTSALAKFRKRSSESFQSSQAGMRLNGTLRGFQPSRRNALGARPVWDRPIRRKFRASDRDCAGSILRFRRACTHAFQQKGSVTFAFGPQPSRSFRAETRRVPSTTPAASLRINCDPEPGCRERWCRERWCVWLLGSGSALRFGRNDSGGRRSTTGVFGFRGQSRAVGAG